MTTKLQQLYHDKAKIEGQIRRERVLKIRQHHAKLNNAAHELDHLITEMERRLEMVVYCHQEFDELLEQIEDMLGL